MPRRKYATDSTPADDQEDNLVTDDECPEIGAGLSDDYVARESNTNHNVPDNISMSTSLRQVQDASRPVYTSQMSTLFILVNVTVGVGLLAMPYAMQTAGVVTSIIMQLFFCSLIIITCIMCIELTVKSDVGSYHEIVERHCHKYAYQFTQVSIFLIVFGAVVAYIVTIGDQSDRLFASRFGDKFCHNWYMNRRFIMTIATMLTIKPLCSARTVDFLKYASFLGIMSISFVFYVVLSYFLKADVTPKNINYFPKSWADVAFILPVFCLAYQCHLSLVPTVATVQRRQKPKAFITATIAMIVAMIIYSSVSMLAVLSFGSKIQKDLTETFPGDDWATLTTIGIVGVKCVLTLPAAYLPARLSIVDILSKIWPRFASLSETTKRISVTFIFLDIALFTAMFMPDILVVVNLLGCLAVMFIFTLPGMAYLSLVKDNRLEKQRGEGGDRNTPHYTSKDKMKQLVSYLMIFTGSVMTIVVLYESIREILDSKPTPPICVN